MTDIKKQNAMNRFRTMASNEVSREINEAFKVHVPVKRIRALVDGMMALYEQVWDNVGEEERRLMNDRR